MSSSADAAHGPVADERQNRGDALAEALERGGPQALGDAGLKPHGRRLGEGEPVEALALLGLLLLLLLRPRELPSFARLRRGLARLDVSPHLLGPALGARLAGDRAQHRDADALGLSWPGRSA
ncbi:hypothetical protein [Nannocystis exedens]|nr:hypothetical protein [Nannocystis exedens]